MRITCFALLGVLISCGGPDDAGITQIGGNDTIKEFEMNNQRLSAVDFNNEMTLMQDGILKEIDALFKSDSSNVDVNLENTLFEIDLNLSSLENMKAPEGSDAFVHAMKNWMTFYQAELKGPFQSIVPLIKKSSWSKSEEQQVDEYDLNFVKQEKAWFDTVYTEQDKFAKANNIKLEDTFN